jgi:hypothetical protein
MKLRQVEKVFLPLLLMIFLITYHYYKFYQDDFNKIFRYVKFSLSEKQYDQIQKFHPYYAVYKLAEETKVNNQNVIYLKTKIDKKNSLYYDELNLMVNYFFYPKIINAYSLLQLNNIKLLKKTIIISDYDLSLEPKFNNTIKSVPFVMIKQFRINRWSEKSFFIYEVI